MIAKSDCSIKTKQNILAPLVEGLCAWRKHVHIYVHQNLVPSVTNSKTLNSNTVFHRFFSSACEFLRALARSLYYQCLSRGYVKMLKLKWDDERFTLI